MAAVCVQDVIIMTSGAQTCKIKCALATTMFVAAVGTDYEFRV